MKVALYARVSTTRQAENELSIPDQLRQLQDWCKANGHLVIYEYVEPGASATDDKRPVFQKMMSEGLAKSPAYEAIIIHSLSRFFRDAIQFGVYERKLGKNGVKIISITQPTADDSSGELVRRILSTFDEYQSKENSKHTSRAMRENARQGFFNGSRPPFGYMAVSTEILGSRGRKKKRLQIDESEAGIIRMIYDLYLHGIEGREVGCKEIAKHLTAKGLLMRGRSWTIQKVHKLLSDSLYMGDYYYNVIDSKTRKVRPAEDRVKTNIPAIVDALVFEKVRAKRTARSPEKSSPRILSSPNLLTGLLKCGCCGKGMTVVTGKSGKFKYYKCTNRQNRGNHACVSGNLPMQKVDDLILSQLADHVFTTKRLQGMISALRQRFKTTKDQKQQRINELNRQLKQQEERRNRLLEAIETGAIDYDTIQRRAQQLKASIEALHIEIAGVRRVEALPLQYLKPSMVDTFGKALRAKLLSADSGLAKGYLKLLVDEIRVEGKEYTVKGRETAVAEAMLKLGHTAQVPSSMVEWRARRDSNS